MSEVETLYICPKCFQVCETEELCHQHQQMVECEPGKAGDERRKPVRDRFGHFVSQAPRWYMEAVGWLKTRSS